MSPDDVLAANLWPWPDPLLKRNGQGQIIFVNAAFLQLYGGNTHDWFGKAIDGWPTPLRNGAQRFETRLGQAEETIYDWVEMVMADGNVMAIARNVTALIAAAKAQVVHIAPPITEIAPAVQAAPQAAPGLNDELEETLGRTADDYAYAKRQAAASSPPPLQEVAPTQPSAEPSPNVEAAAQRAPEPVSGSTNTNNRATERRALPIEDSTSILGSNWRDQVIAKAVGADMPPDEPQQETPPSTDDEHYEGAGAGAAGLQILLAEDNAINALLTRTLLEAEGASVDTVEDGALAVEAVKKKRYDLIIMDMRMPNMDGLEATRKIRAMGGAHANMPIIALTANAFDDDRNACFDSGMNDFMTKPVSAEELMEMVNVWMKPEEDKEKLTG